MEISDGELQKYWKELSIFFIRGFFFCSSLTSSTKLSLTSDFVRIFERCQKMPIRRCGARDFIIRGILRTSLSNAIHSRIRFAFSERSMSLKYHYARFSSTDTIENSISSRRICNRARFSNRELSRRTIANWGKYDRRYQSIEQESSLATSSHVTSFFTLFLNVASRFPGCHLVKT